MKWRVLDQTIAEARSKFADLPNEELQALLDDAVEWARSEEHSLPLHVGGD